ncbi:MAG TPA: hypothetical protein GX526_02790 [Thermoanaerobacterales bacterium]|nr:hypothetical protein [Thermoanaerobacterales bacterium]
MDYEIKHYDLLENCVDIHLHVAPSLIPRKMDIFQMAKRAEEYNYKAIIYKDHHALTAHCAKLANDHFSKDSNLKVFGAVCLNNSVGGLKAEVVESAIGFGAKIIWLPTVSAKNHIDYITKHDKFPKLANDVTINETPIPFVDKNGECREEIINIFEILKAHDNILLGAGHGDADEINTVVEKAAEMGMSDRILIDHPTFIINASLDLIKHWAELGCYIEHTAALSVPWSSHYDIPPVELVELIRLVGVEQSILASDYGQKDNGDPIEGYDALFDVLLQNGITKDEIILMSREIPSALLGLN